MTSGLEDWNNLDTKNISRPNALKYYDDWVDAHDKDYKKLNRAMTEDINYNGPKILANILEPYWETLPDLRRVLDVGAGFGYLGAELRSRLGPHVVIDCLEPSESMASVARQIPGLYTNFYGEFIDGINSSKLESNTYDCVCWAACFVPGHIPPHGVREMVRLARRGGLVALITRQEFVHGDGEYAVTFRDVTRRLEDDPGVEVVEQRERVPAYLEHRYEGYVIVWKKVGELKNE